MCSDTSNVEYNIQQNERLIWYTLDKYYPQYLSDEDMVQELRIILWRCLELYDETQGASFSNYCIHAMINRIRNIHRINTLPGKIPAEALYGLDAPIVNNDGTSILVKDIIEAPDESLLEMNYFFTFLDTLKPSHKKVAELLIEGYRQIDISKILGCSQPQVSRIKRTIINKYRIWKGGNDGEVKSGYYHQRISAWSV